MNQDTMPIAQLERGFSTLAHDWRNVLNDINLRLLCASTAEEAGQRDADLAEITDLIRGATKNLAAISRKITRPVVSPIAYPVADLVEDLRAALKVQLGNSSVRLNWELQMAKGRALVDYEAFLQALGEIVSNSLRHVTESSSLIVQVCETATTLDFSILDPDSAAVSPEKWGLTPFDSTSKNRLGLGVYYARRVLGAHGGGLDYRFTEADHTLHTTLQLPLEPA